MAAAVNKHESINELCSTSEEDDRAEDESDADDEEEERTKSIAFEVAVSDSGHDSPKHSFAA